MMGTHILLSLHGVSFDLLEDRFAIIQAFDEACRVMGATVLNKFVHVFDPFGLTIVYSLAESHISIHTFPERESCAIDVYTCGNMQTSLGADILVQHFNPSKIDRLEVMR